ncbi:MAG: phosphatase PAP2 family protein [Firmicutes bacterium]|nr:phosphatase PAP2 family protein [Bacillota bacterium]
MTDPQKTILRRATAGFCAGGFLLLLLLVAGGSTAGFDNAVLSFFCSLRSDLLTPAVIAMTNTANRYFIIGLCLLLLIIPRTRLPFGVPLSAASLAMTIVNHLIKDAVCRPRPEVLHLAQEGGFSFPSGHSEGSMVFYGLAIWLVWHYAKAGGPFHYSKKTAMILTVLLLIPLVLVGPTRLYLGVHFPTDVLAGWCLGAAAVTVTAEIILTVEQHRTQNRTAPGSRSK